jgi:UDP-glucuronate 4-epimerase
MFRDFTYIDDVIESLLKVLVKPPFPDKDFDKRNPDPSNSWCPYKIFNIGNSQPKSLMEYIHAIEDNLKIEAKINYMPMQMGDVPYTYSDSSKLESWIKYKPKTSIKIGVSKFINWYRNFYKI